MRFTADIEDNDEVVVDTTVNDNQSDPENMDSDDNCDDHINEDVQME